MEGIVIPSVIDENTQFIDELTNTPIVNGYVYIGTHKLDAKLNPITIYPDRELSGTPLANPQRTGADGRVENKIWVPGKHSMKVEDSANVQKLNDLDLGEETQIGNTKLIDPLGVNDVTVTGSPTVTELVDNQTYIFEAPADNTGAMTLKIDTLSVYPIRKSHDQAFIGGEVKQGQKMVVVWNESDSWFEYLVPVPSRDAVATGHIRAGNIQLVDGTHSTTTQQPAGMSSSIGPTGSGAANIWTAMDNMPSAARILLADLYISMEGSATFGSVSAYASATSTTADVDNRIFHYDYDNATANDTDQMVRVMIPLNSSDLTFYCAVTNTDVTTDPIALYYRGFITDTL